MTILLRKRELVALLFVDLCVCVGGGGEGKVEGVLSVLVCLLFLLASLEAMFCDCGSSWTSSILFFKEVVGRFHSTILTYYL